MPTKLTKLWMSTTLVAFFAYFFGVCGAANVTIANNCKYTIWPAYLSSTFSSDGFILRPHKFRTLELRPGWKGMFWARTGCAQGLGPHGVWGCKTGDCRTGRVQCSAWPTPPETFVEFGSLGAKGANDKYRVSVSLGFNVPVSVVPTKANCLASSCTANINAVCPAHLRVRGGAGGRTVVACMSPCQGLGDDRSCCAGQFRGPQRCKPTALMDFFRAQCGRRAVSFEYDSNYVSCARDTNYLVTFCP